MKTIKNRFVSAIDSGKITDHGKGLVTFNNDLVINSGEPMHDGLRYDINSLDISDYKGKVFASHNYDNLSSLLGTFTNVVKKAGRLVAEGMQFSMANPQGQLAYEMVLEGHLDEVSVGTMGFGANENGVYEDHLVYETSFVLVPNDPKAAINSPLIRAVANGMDVSAFTTPSEKTEKTTNTIKKKEAIMSDVSDKAPAEDVKVEAKDAVVENNSDLKAEMNKLTDIVSTLVENSKVIESPTFKDTGVIQNAVDAKKEKVEALTNMHPGDRLKRQIQITSAKRVSQDEIEELESINEINRASILASDKIDGTLKEVARKNDMYVNNPHTTLDELTGIVLPAEVIEGMYDVVTAYDGLNSMFGYSATNSVLFESRILASKMDLAWLSAKEDDGADGNLKPLTNIQIKKQIMQMEEYAGVLIFSDFSLQSGGVNLIEEVAREGREAEARLLANLTIGTFERGVETRVAGTTIDGFVFPADPLGSTAFAAATGTEKEKAQALVDYVNVHQGQLVNGVMVMSKHSSGTLRVQMGLTANQALDRGELGEDPVLSRLFGHTVITVPNDLMPQINSGLTTTVGTPSGAVTVDHSVFFLERTNWDGKQFMGGSQMDSSDTAAYEIGGQTKSAYMRDETVVRIYGYATAQLKDFRFITGLQSNAA